MRHVDMTSPEWLELLAELAALKLENRVTRRTEWDTVLLPLFDRSTDLAATVRGSGLFAEWTAKHDHGRYDIGTARTAAVRPLYVPTATATAADAYSMLVTRWPEFGGSLALAERIAAYRSGEYLKCLQMIERARHAATYPTIYRVTSIPARPARPMAERIAVGGRWSLVPVADVAASADLRHGRTTTALEQYADLLIRVDNVRRGLPETTDVVRLDVTDGQTRRITTAPDAVAFRGVTRYQRRAALTYYKQSHKLTTTANEYRCDITTTTARVTRDNRPITWHMFGPFTADYRSPVAVASHAPNHTATLVTRAAGDLAPRLYRVTQLVTRETGTAVGFVGHTRTLFTTTANPTRTAERAERITAGITTANGGRPVADPWSCSPRSLARRMAALPDDIRERAATFTVMLTAAGTVADVALTDTERVSIHDQRVTRANGQTYSAAEYVRRAALAGIFNS